MDASRKLLALSLVVVMASAMFAVAMAPRALPQARATAATVLNAASATGLSLPFSTNARYFDPALQDAVGRIDVIVAIRTSAPIASIAQFMTGARAMPSIGDVRLVRGLIDASRVADLQASPDVLAVLKDRPIGFDVPQKTLPASSLGAKLRNFHLPEPASSQREPLRGDAEVTMRDVVNFTGARRAWTQLGVDGTGSTIAVVDTGVDFGAFNLGESAVARDANGVPYSFDPDGSNFAWTMDTVTAFPGGAQVFVTSAGTDPLIYIFDLFGAFPGGYGPKAFTWSFLFGGPFPTNMEITGLPLSKSGNYSFGVLFQWNFGFDFYPVLLIDTTTAGVYDTAYLDLSFDWWFQGFDPSPSPDFSFTDEKRLSPTPGGNVVASRDMDLDGYPDISAGVLATGLDIWGLDPTPGPSGYTYTAPLDADGEYITMVYDWNSHGTSVAASAAGRESNHPVAGPGTGPGAKVMGVPIFAWFDIIEGWLYAAGFDLTTDTTFRSVNNYGGVYGLWGYTGAHKADIISNSWGSSDFVTFQQANGWPWYDVLTVIEDALMTPGYSDLAYPGTVMVHAGGNGASGYGTVSEPGFNSLAITVGASTNLNYTSLPYAGTHFDVISWSARGPNLYGVPKPDVLQVGAFAWAAAPVWSGFGNGFDAYTLFSGTSQATPVTSGSAAVVIDAYMAGHAGARPSPFEVKSILKSTARDIGYDPFVQGAGHVDVYNAAAFAIGNAGIDTTTPASWDNLRPMVSSPWASAYVFYGDDQVGPTPPSGPIGDPSWYAGAVRPGSSTAATFTTAAASGTVSGSISAVFHSKMATSFTLTGTTGILPGPPGSWLEGYGAFNVLLPAAIPAAADLMVVRSGQPYTFLDTDGNYVWDNRSRIILADWVDDGDSVIEPNEISVFNYGYNTGTTSEARVGFPATRFAGLPLLWFSQVPAPGRTFVSMPYRVEVEFYQRLAWPWITAPATFSATAGTPATWSATLSVPAGAVPGVYEGQIILTPTGGNATALPVSVVVPAVFDSGTLSVTMTSSGSAQIYNPSQVLGYFDWRWRYEAGDWKLWFADVEDPTTIALYSEVSWTGANTDVDVISVLPSSIPSDSSFSPYLGSGRFGWSTRTGTTADWVATPTSSSVFGESAPGLYTVALHNVLLGDGAAATTSDTLTGTIGAAKLNPRGPITIVTQPGTVVTIPFTLTTGYDIAFAFPLNAPPPTSAFPSTVEPSFIGGLLAGESAMFWLNITVPADTPDGSYMNLAGVGGSPLPFTIVPVTVVVVADTSSPAVSISAPAANAWVRGTITATFSATDANLRTATLSYGGTSVNVTGMTSAPVDTTTLADGSRAITLTAEDFAGHVSTASVTVNVDNTDPTAVLTDPASGTFLRGSSAFDFVATDANVDTAELTIGATVFDVAGQPVPYSVDTTALADGTYTATLTVRDLAGNSASDSVSVTIDNTAPSVALTSPTNNSNLRGTATIAWTVTEANPQAVWLIIDGVQRDVTGTTSYSWDTSKAGDGAHTVVVQAFDRAGNAGSASARVSTDNVQLAVNSGFTNGLLIGLVAAAVAGFLIGWFIGRRRKQKPAMDMPPPAPSPPMSDEEL